MCSLVERNSIVISRKTVHTEYSFLDFNSLFVSIHSFRLEYSTEKKARTNQYKKWAVAQCLHITEEYGTKTFRILFSMGNNWFLFNSKQHSHYRLCVSCCLKYIPTITRPINSWSLNRATLRARATLHSNHWLEDPHL